MGTVLLTACYFFINIGGIAQLISKILGAFKPEVLVYIGIFQVAYLASIGLLFLYYFANRHILQDNDFLKSSTLIFLGALSGLISGLVISEMVHQTESPFFHSVSLDPSLDMINFLTNPIINGIFFIPFFFLIHVRIIIGIIRLRKVLENKVVRRGFTYILLSVVSLAIATLVTMFYTFPLVKGNLVLTFVVQHFRIFFSILGVILGYLGWVMPNWLKRRIRGKVWIAEQISKSPTYQRTNCFFESKEHFH